MKLRIPKIILDASELVVLIITTIIMIVGILVFNGINDNSNYKRDGKFKIINSMVEKNSEQGGIYEKD